MIVKIEYLRRQDVLEMAGQEEKERIKMLQEAEQGGADLSPCDFEFLKKYSQPKDSPRHVLIECDSINVRETEDTWGFTPYREGNAITHYDFPLVDGVCAYVLEQGETVDRLPSR